MLVHISDPHGLKKEVLLIIKVMVLTLSQKSPVNNIILLIRGIVPFVMMVRYFVQGQMVMVN